RSGRFVFYSSGELLDLPSFPTRRSSDLYAAAAEAEYYLGLARQMGGEFFRAAPKLRLVQLLSAGYDRVDVEAARKAGVPVANNGDRKSTRLNSSHVSISYAVFCLKKKKR